MNRCKVLLETQSQWVIALPTDSRIHLPTCCPSQTFISNPLLSSELQIHQKLQLLSADSLGLPPNLSPVCQRDLEHPHHQFAQAISARVLLPSTTSFLLSSIRHSPSVVYSGSAVSAAALPAQHASPCRVPGFPRLLPASLCSGPKLAVTEIF